MKKLLLLALLSTSAFANHEEVIGTIVASKGDISDQNRTILVQGDKVSANDIIVTGNRSFTVIQLRDGAKITVRPNSKLLIEEYGDSNASLSLLGGGLRVITGAIAKENPENFKIRTPVALMGVRGTEFSIQYLDK